MFGCQDSRGGWGYQEGPKPPRPEIGSMQILFVGIRWYLGLGVWGLELRVWGSRLVVCLSFAPV